MTLTELFEFWDEYCRLLAEEAETEARAELEAERIDDPYLVFGVSRGAF